jgi:hypothetical protein
MTWIRIRMDPLSFSKLGPDPDPHSRKQLDPDPDPQKVNANSKLWTTHSITIITAGAEEPKGLG